MTLGWYGYGPLALEQCRYTFKILRHDWHDWSDRSSGGGSRP